MKGSFKRGLPSFHTGGIFYFIYFLAFPFHLVSLFSHLADANPIAGPSELDLSLGPYKDRGRLTSLPYLQTSLRIFKSRLFAIVWSQRTLFTVPLTKIPSSTMTSSQCATVCTTPVVNKVRLSPAVHVWYLYFCVEMLTLPRCLVCDAPTVKLRGKRSG